MARPEQERKIWLRRPGLDPVWRAELPVFLDQTANPAALVEYAVKLYYR